MSPKEVAGRTGKQAHGSNSTRETKVIVIWMAEQREDYDDAVADAGSIKLLRCDRQRRFTRHRS